MRLVWGIVIARAMIRTSSVARTELIDPSSSNVSVMFARMDFSDEILLANKLSDVTDRLMPACDAMRLLYGAMML